MQWLRAIFREVVGLFVDDGSFALAIVVWLAISWLVLSRMALVDARWDGPILFGGLALILVESAMRRARK